MDTIEQLHTIYKLKEVERKCKVKDRQESTAEHVFSCMLLAKHFLRKVSGLDEKKVYDILLFHDLVEIHAGDTFILEENNNQKEREEKAFQRLKKELPEEFLEEFKDSWKDFEEQKTREARFCKAIDHLDPIIHSIYKPNDWKKHGFTEKKLREKKEQYFTGFPELKKFFNELIEYAKEKKIISEEES